MSGPHDPLPTEVCARKTRDGEMVFPAHPRTDDPHSPSRHGSRGFLLAGVGLRLRSCMVRLEHRADSAWPFGLERFTTVQTGDRWLLARDPDSGRVFVRHEPNLPSGGQVADIEIGAFL